MEKQVEKQLRVAVWDTWVRKPNGERMHFDIIVPADRSEEEFVIRCGHEYLGSKGITGIDLRTQSCSFCHVETVRPEWERQLRKKGYAIHEMQGC